MRALKAVFLLNFARLLGIGWGWVVWGRQVDRLGRELAIARSSSGGEREWHATGIIRAVLPDIDVVVITHDELSGFMPAMTMGFRTASPRLHQGLAVGDPVRFTLRGTPPTVAITAIEKIR